MRKFVPNITIKSTFSFFGKPELWSVFDTGVHAAALDDMLHNAGYRASVVHECEQGEKVYRPELDGRFTVQLLDIGRQHDVINMVKAYGFQVVGKDCDI